MTLFFYSISSLILLKAAYIIFIFHKNLKYLKNVTLERKSSWPTVSLVVPACNEDDTIGPALRSILQLNYPNYEVIAVNDRSTDKTGSQIDQLSAEFGHQLKSVHIQLLPEGWLGKVNAMNEALKHAQGDWILFTDADVHFSSDALKKAISYADANKIDFLTVSPELVAQSFFLKSFLCQFLHHGSLALKLDRVESPKHSDAIGIGAFNLVRRKVLDQMGGLERIKLDVIDDGALAWCIKKSGARCAILNGNSEIKIEWYKSLQQLAKGLEKNAFALFGYKLTPLIAMNSALWLIAATVFYAPAYLLIQTPLELSAGVYIGSLITYMFVSGYSLKVGSQMPALMVLTFPLTLPLVPYFNLRSAYVTLKNKGIFWRDTYYPLFLLKAEMTFSPFKMMGHRPPHPYLETDRIILNEITKDDISRLYDLNSDPEVMKYITGGKTSTVDEIKKVIDLVMAYKPRYQGRYGVWNAYLKSTGEFIGFYILRPSKNDPDNTDVIELGYRLKKKFWRQGYGYEVSLALVDRAFKTYKAKTVFAIAMVDNIGSIAVMKKVGLKFKNQYEEDGTNIAKGSIVARYEMDSRDGLTKNHVERPLEL